MNLLESDDRNILLVVGPSGAGKTEVLRALHSNLIEHGVPVQLPVLSDAQSIMNHVLADDMQKGSHHMHPTGEAYGHSHEWGLPVTPFTVTDSVIPFAMQVDFLNELAKSVSTPGWATLAEMSYGTNGMGDYLPGGKVDMSAKSIAERTWKRQLNRAGWQRVGALVHVYADFETRLERNRQRLIYPPSVEEVAQNLASWGLEERTGMQLFFGDDWEHFAGLARAQRIPHVVTIYNDGQELSHQIRDAVLPLFGIETTGFWGR